MKKMSACKIRITIITAPMILACLDAIFAMTGEVSVGLEAGDVLVMEDRAPWKWAVDPGGDSGRNVIAMVWPLLLLATPCTSSCTEHAIRVFNVCVLAHARCERARERCDGHSSACLHTSFMSMRHQHSAHDSGTSGPTSGGRRVEGKRHK